ncbi:hypothetical protein [Formosimonas limnophila]|uniref:hypothetical protein n=1 Tax=Formosimonas limnophila TaxID=1384487 RepID=UPI00167B6976|nr:hypothetical protein [Formosimonas limnophila]
MVQYLSLITGINWRRPYEQASRGESQYGVVHVLSINPTGLRKTERIESDTEVCEVVTMQYSCDLQLDVYRGSGEKTSFSNPDPVTQPYASAIDVLAKVITRSQLLVFQDALAQYGIDASDFAVRINNVPQEMRHGVFEEHAVMRPTIKVCMSQSIKVATIKSPAVASCDGFLIQQLPQDGNCN